jgi:hypothetical protein
MTDATEASAGESSHRAGRIGSVFGHPLVKVLLYYAALAVGILLVKQIAPELYRALSSGEIPESPDFGTAIDMTKPGREAVKSVFAPGVSALIGMSATFVLMVPVVWIYVFTRHKKGYQQSLVQTLVMLPIVTAAVIILVQNSVALAFGLGGVVGAVSFRNRLEDTKDAVYVFVAIGVGLACGVEVIEIALALTVFFNFIIVVLWYTDFGRVPAQLQASVASKRVDKVKGMVGQEGRASGEFVSVLDKQILQSMTPDQLELLAERALKRQRKMSEHLFGDGEKGKDKDKEKDKDKDKDKVEDEGEPKFDGTLKVTVAEGASADAVRATIERVLAQDSKAWEFYQASMGDFKTILEFKVRWKKTAPRPIMLETLRRTLLTQAEQVIFE